uniref:ATP synthase F0 subunit 8 n=1 Tax=Diaphanes sp. FM11 TaxID=2596685 RepID=A0A5C0Q0D3_9COLE|nr:ATP synthase F0 subunit 8 [Diaphanes sp. FM11]
MPQMSPMNWIMLMIYFSLSMVVYNMMIYTVFNYTKKLLKKNNKIIVNWKW